MGENLEEIIRREFDVRLVYFGVGGKEVKEVDETFLSCGDYFGVYGSFFFGKIEK